MKRNLSWAEIENACEYLVEEMMLDDYEPDVVVGISPDGMIPAALIAQKLPKLKQLFAAPVKDIGNLLYTFPIKRCLLVEGVMTRESWTFEDYGNVFWSRIDYHVAAVHCQAHAEHAKPNYFSSLINADMQIIYPWN
tara:strand:+ start:479 stop:889 length:411 start_codon:yes stop_codon:yes gene_type:complete